MSEIKGGDRLSDISFKGCSRCVNASAPIILKDPRNICVRCMSDHKHPHKFYKEKEEVAFMSYLILPDTCDIGEISDGIHTFNGLYHQRAILFAALVNQNPDISWKSWKHDDGEYCFNSNGEWFIVGIDTPEGSYTYHYKKEYFDIFKCQELPVAKSWDGHTEEDVTRLLSLSRKDA